MNQATLSQIIKSIVSHQTQIIGPLAQQQANKVSGLTISSDLNSITISGNSKTILGDLVHHYEQIFGQASVEACKDAVRETQLSLPKDDLPAILQ